MLTQQEVAKQYRLQSGYVIDPGKFEGQHWSVVAMNDLAMDGAANESWHWSDDEVEEVFILDDELRAAIGANADAHAFMLFTDSQGFVVGYQVDQKTFEGMATDYEKYCENLEKSS